MDGLHVYLNYIVDDLYLMICSITSSQTSLLAAQPNRPGSRGLTQKTKYDPNFFNFDIIKLNSWQRVHSSKFKMVLFLFTSTKDFYRNLSLGSFSLLFFFYTFALPRSAATTYILEKSSPKSKNENVCISTS